MCTVRKSWTISRSDVTADRSVFCHLFKQNNNSLKHQNLPARVDKRAAEKEAVRCRLVHKPIKHHLPVPRTDGHSEFEARAVALRQQVHHLHVKGHGWSCGDGRKVVGHLFTINSNSTWKEKRHLQGYILLEMEKKGLERVGIIQHLQFSDQ